MFLFSLVDRMNDFLFSLFIRFAMMRARSRESLVQAAARGDTGKIWKLAPKSNLSETDDEGRTALHVVLEKLEEAVAAEEDAAEEEAEALPAATPVVAPTSATMMRRVDEPPQSAADTERASSSAEWQAIVHCLLEHQADVNAISAQACAPLHIAVRAGLHEVCRALIEAGADPALLSKGKTTLLQAVARRDTKMVALLLDAAYPSGGGGPRAVAPLELAPLRAVDYVNTIGRDGWSALGLAARFGDAAIVKALLDAGADRSAVMKTGKTALEIARANKKAAVVSLLES